MSKPRTPNYRNGSETRPPNDLMMAWLLTGRTFRTGERYIRKIERKEMKNQGFVRLLAEPRFPKRCPGAGAEPSPGWEHGSDTARCGACPIPAPSRPHGGLQPPQGERRSTQSNPGIAAPRAAHLPSRPGEGAVAAADVERKTREIRGTKEKKKNVNPYELGDSLKESTI